MAATTLPPEKVSSPQILRFDRVERILHWVNAVLFLTLILTGAVLYLSSLQSLIGRRALVENIHVYCGVALPVPVLLAVFGPWGAALRADLRRFNRWSADDRRWIRAAGKPRAVRRHQMAKLRSGKFNAGQKLNAAFIAGAGLVMLGTGVIMRWYHPWPLSWRTGATFVHDWLAIAVGLVVLGHIGMALRDPDAMRSMFKGTVSRQWARLHAPAWEDGRDGQAVPASPTGPHK